MTRNSTHPHQEPDLDVPDASDSAIVFLPIEEVGRRIGVSRRTVYNLIEKSEGFPQPVQISDRRVGFVEAEVTAWQRKKVEARQYA